MSGVAWQSRMELARTIAVEAGELTLQYFRKPGLEVQHKSDGSPLTLADQESERWLRKRIGEAFPEDAIVGEEFGEQAGTSPCRWVLDPIDGTKSFISGVPLYGTMVGVQVDAAAVVGAIWFPPLREGMFAGRGLGSWCFSADSAPVRAQVRTTGEPSRRVLLTTCEQTLARRIGPERWQRLGAEFGICRTWGDVYGYYLVASGRADAMIDPHMNVWDAAAVQPIVLEAGGEFSDWKGQPRIDGGDSVASTNPALHARVLEILCG